MLSVVLRVGMSHIGVVGVGLCVGMRTGMFCLGFSVIFRSFGRLGLRDPRDGNVSVSWWSRGHGCVHRLSFGCHYELW